MGNEQSYSETVYEPENLTPPVIPLYKKALCGNHMFGDFFHLFWRNVRCPDNFCACCRFFQGLVLSLAIVSIVLWNC